MAGGQANWLNDGWVRDGQKTDEWVVHGQMKAVGPAIAQAPLLDIYCITT